MRELIIVNLAGVKYGIWADQVLAVRSDLVRHCRPYGSGNPCITGTVLLENRFLAIADLANCLGYSKMDRGDRVLILLPVKGEIAGFLVDGGSERVSVEENAIYSLSDFAKSRVVDTCVIVGPALVPVIDVTTLQQLLRNAKFKPVVQRPNTRLLDPISPARIKSEKWVQCGGRTSVIEASGDLSESSTPEYIIRFPVNRVNSIDGLIMIDREILPFFQFSQKIRSPGKAANIFLLVQLEQIQFAVSVESVVDAQVAVEGDIPELMRTTWMTRGYIAGQQIFPIIDLDQLFLSRFSFKSDVNLAETPYILPSDTRQIVEVFVQGERFGIPRQDVVGATRIRSIKPIPKLSPVILGSVVFKGSVIPVLDLAACYGQKSSVSKEWRLVLIQTSHFPVFLAVEKVLKPKRLPLNIFRDPTIQLPYQFNYGCYFDGKSEKQVPILNIHNVALYSKLDPTNDLQNSLLEITHITEGPSTEHRLDMSREVRIQAKQSEAPPLAATNQFTSADPGESSVPLDIGEIADIEELDDDLTPSIQQTADLVESDKAPVPVTDDAFIPIPTAETALDHIETVERTTAPEIIPSEAVVLTPEDNYISDGFLPQNNTTPDQTEPEESIEISESNPLGTIESKEETDLNLDKIKGAEVEENGFRINPAHSSPIVRNERDTLLDDKKIDESEPSLTDDVQAEDNNLTATEREEEEESINVEERLTLSEAADEGPEIILTRRSLLILDFVHKSQTAEALEQAVGAQSALLTLNEGASEGLSFTRQDRNISLFNDRNQSTELISKRSEVKTNSAKPVSSEITGNGPIPEPETDAKASELPDIPTQDGRQGKPLIMPDAEKNVTWNESADTAKIPHREITRSETVLCFIDSNQSAECHLRFGERTVGLTHSESSDDVTRSDHMKSKSKVMNIDQVNQCAETISSEAKPVMMGEPGSDLADVPLREESDNPEPLETENQSKMTDPPLVPDQTEDFIHQGDLNDENRDASATPESIPVNLNKMEPSSLVQKENRENDSVTSESLEAELTSDHFSGEDAQDFDQLEEKITDDVAAARKAPSDPDSIEPEKKESAIAPETCGISESEHHSDVSKKVNQHTNETIKSDSGKSTICEAATKWVSPEFKDAIPYSQHLDDLSQAAERYPASDEKHSISSVPRRGNIPAPDPKNERSTASEREAKQPLDSDTTTKEVPATVDPPPASVSQEPYEGLSANLTTVQAFEAENHIAATVTRTEKKIITGKAKESAKPRKRVYIKESPAEKKIEKPKAKKPEKRVRDRRVLLIAAALILIVGTIYYQINRESSLITDTKSRQETEIDQLPASADGFRDVSEIGVGKSGDIANTDQALLSHEETGSVQKEEHPTEQIDTTVISAKEANEWTSTVDEQNEPEPVSFAVDPPEAIQEMAKMEKTDIAASFPESQNSATGSAGKESIQIREPKSFISKSESEGIKKPTESPLEANDPLERTSSLFQNDSQSEDIENVSEIVAEHIDPSRQNGGDQTEKVANRPLGDQKEPTETWIQEPSIGETEMKAEPLGANRTPVNSNSQATEQTETTERERLDLENGGDINTADIKDAATFPSENGNPLPPPYKDAVRREPELNYTVKKGDFLSKITKLYTGNGYDYPKVARENKIPNADLIYPNQVIRFKKEWLIQRNDQWKE